MSARDVNVRRHLRRAWSDPTASPVRVRRLALNLTRAELAAAASVSARTIARLEDLGRGHERTWFAVADALGCERSDIDPTFREALT